MFKVRFRVRAPGCVQSRVHACRVETHGPHLLRLIIQAPKDAPGQFEVDMSPELLAHVARHYIGFRDQQPPTNEEVLNAYFRMAGQGTEGGDNGTRD